MQLRNICEHTLGYSSAVRSHYRKTFNSSVNWLIIINHNNNNADAQDDIYSAIIYGASHMRVYFGSFA